jgi:hypothetical protein
MAGNRLSDLFAKQFTETADGWIFRARQTGPAIAVTRQERDLFVTGFNQSTRRFEKMILRCFLISFLLAIAVLLARPAALLGWGLVIAYGILSLFTSLNALHDSIAFGFPKMALSKRPILDPVTQSPTEADDTFRRHVLTLWTQPAMFSVLLLMSIWSAPRRTEPSDAFFLFLAGMAVLGWLIVELNPRFFASKQTENQ